MSEEIKEIPLKERIEKLLESGWVNEFNYLESQLQEARSLVVILQQKVEQLEKENRQLCDVRYSLDRVQLEKRIEQLEERCAYLERSNNRREDEIIELRDENVDLASKNKQLENIRKEAIKLIESDDIIVKYQDFENKYTVNFYDKKQDLLNILNKGSEDNE